MFIKVEVNLNCRTNITSARKNRAGGTKSFSCKRNGSFSLDSIQSLKRPKVISEEKMETILEDLKLGTSKATICRNFGTKRTALYDALDRYKIKEQK